MPSIPGSGSPTESDSVGRSPRERVRHAFLTGLALLIPLVLTLVVLQIALNLVAQAVSPIVATFELVFGRNEAPEVVLQAITVASLGAVILLIGFVAEYRTGPGRISESFDALMARIPGLGSVYTGTRRMSEVLLEPDTQAFQEVKLVEFPREGAFMLGFLTAQPPEALEDAADAPGLVTLFVPLAPNPVMGGFLVHVSSDRVDDVDLTVEEGVQAIMTSGAAIDPRVEHVDVGGGTGIRDGPVLDASAFESALFGPEVFDSFVGDDEEEPPV